MTRLARRLLLAGGVVGAALFLAWLFVFGVYRVDGRSMEPTVHGEDGGELLLVLYERFRPRRNELAVLLPPGLSEPRVKRALGLPGETIAIRRGDLFVDGHVLPPDAPRPAPVLLFDDRRQRVEDAFMMGSTEVDPWSREGDEWALDARDVLRGADAGLMFLHGPLKDGYVGADGALVEGREEVNDAVLELEFRWEDPPATVRAGLLEQGDLFHVRLEPEEGDGVLATLNRRSPEGSELLAEARTSLDRGAWHALRFSNVDDHLRCEVDGARLLAASYAGNRLHPSDHQQRGLSFGSRLYLGGEAGRARFRRIRVLRDLYYTARGTHATREEVTLGPDEIFVLGDNSRESRDSRDWGPVGLDSIVGRPEWVVWPPASARRLAGPAVAGARR